MTLRHAQLEVKLATYEQQVQCPIHYTKPPNEATIDKKLDGILVNHYLFSLFRKPYRGTSRMYLV